MTNPLITKLRTVADLSDDDCRAVEALCSTKRKISKNQDIVSEGETPQFVFILLEGWAARYTILPDGSRQITGILIPGDLCETGATILRQIDHSIVALAPVVVACVWRPALIGLTRERPNLVHAFWWASLVDEAVLRTWIVNIGRRDAHTRIAHLLCELHARMKRVGLAEGGKLGLLLTQDELADAVGLTAVHTNRVLQRLRAEGLITWRQGTLTIDGERLAKAAGFNPGYLHTAVL